MPDVRTDWYQVCDTEKKSSQSEVLYQQVLALENLFSRFMKITIPLAVLGLGRSGSGKTYRSVCELMPSYFK